jgi:hypothetical protein
VNITWSAAKSVTVCAYYLCLYGPNDTDCDPIECPEGSEPWSMTFNDVEPNGCCMTGASGNLTFSVNAPYTTDETGLVYFNVKNGSTSGCQEVSVKLGFSSNASPVCDPATTCCSPSGTWAAKDTPCGAVTKTEYKCSAAGAGSAVQVRTATGGCSGTSATCSSTSTQWGPWTTSLACLDSEVCSVSSSSQPGTCLSAPPGSCDESCGGQSKDGTCYCDALCTSTGDCCADFQATCSGSCEGSCGDQSATGPCYCDDFCVEAGDCCLDKAAKCGN